MMERDCENHTRWKHKRRGTFEGTCGIRWLQNGQVQKNGSEHEKCKIQLMISTDSSLNETIHHRAQKEKEHRDWKEG